VSEESLVLLVSDPRVLVLVGRVLATERDSGIRVGYGEGTGKTMRLRWAGALIEQRRSCTSSRRSYHRMPSSPSL
jgi:hypothetical protein